MAERTEDPNVLAVQAMIDALEPAARRRAHTVADILRDLINRPGNEGHEIELAFTLVLAERAAL